MKKNLHMMEKQWDSYRTQVLPADAPQVQIVECRRAFLCGAIAAISTMGLLSYLPEAEAVDECGTMLEELKRLAAREHA